MTPTEIKFLLWALTILLAILGFIGGLFVHAFIKMAKDISEIKTEIKVAAAKHDGLERRVEHLEETR